MSTAYWHYFISLEKDFIRTMDYVELAPENSHTYSDNFAKLLLATGSEVDVICKALCKAIDSSRTPSNIVEYREIITADLFPWDSWEPSVAKSPDWWKAYNEIKHNRVANFSMATQRNALSALCGLVLLNRYYHRAVNIPSDHTHPQPMGDLLEAGSPGYIITHDLRTLPHF